MPATEERRPEYILLNIAEIISAVEGDVLFQLSLDGRGEVIDIECLASPTQPKNMIPLDLLLEGPLGLGAHSVLYVSNASGSLIPPSECDVDFTARLIAEGVRVGMPVEDHYLAKNGRYDSLKDRTALWT